MSRFHALLDSTGAKPHPTSLWWRRRVEVDPQTGYHFVIETDRMPDPWMVSISTYDGLSAELPIDAFKVIEFEMIGDFGLSVRVPPIQPPLLDILAPFPPSITGWKPLTHTGEHKWPGHGDDGYTSNYGGYASRTTWETKGSFE